MNLSELRKDCIILAHNYQRPEIQDIADFVGDSLGLCIEATKIEKDYILFCGVDFMAESAAMLNPDKTVLMPDLRAKCPMAAMLPADEVLKAKEEHPNAAVVLYINSLLEARAEADVICTSANSVKIVKAMKEKEILFGPDANLAWHVSRHVPEKQIIPIPRHGYCRVHIKFFKEQILKLKKEHPNAEALIHPECIPEVQLLADHICSTEQMINRAKESSIKEFIIATEPGLIHRLKKEAPDKIFFPALEYNICVNMKMHTMDKVLTELEERKNVVKIDYEVRERARKSLDRMLELT